MEDERSFYCGVTHDIKCSLTRTVYRDTYPPTFSDWVVWDSDGDDATMTFWSYPAAREYYEARVKHHMENANVR